MEGLIFGCPYEKVIDGCPFLRIRRLPLAERFNYFEELSSKEKAKLTGHHKVCISKRGNNQSKKLKYTE